MFVVIQYPMADLRAILKDRAGRLLLPDWSHPQSKQTGFVRNLGPFGIRQAGGVDGMAGEGVAAQFSNLVRFNGPIHCRTSSTNESHPLRVWFRRLYFDGQITGRLEIGLLTDPFWLARRTRESQPVALDVLELCETLQEIHITVREDVPLKVPLLSARKALSLSYLNATTTHKQLSSYPPVETVGQALEIGDPLVYIRCPRGERLDIPTHARVVSLQSQNFSEMRCLVHMEGHVRFPVWMRLSSAVGDEPRAERNLRVMLSRLNAESFALGHLTSFCASGSKSLEIDPAKKSELDALIQLTLGNSEQEDTLAASSLKLQQAEKVFRSLLPGQREDVLQQLRTLAEKRAAARNKKTFLGAVKDFAASFVTTAEKTVIEFWLKKATGE